MHPSKKFQDDTELLKNEKLTTAELLASLPRQRPDIWFVENENGIDSPLFVDCGTVILKKSSLKRL